MTLINTQNALQEYCARLARAEIVFLDTEFLRETTYYPLLCLIQAKIPGEGEEPVAIDALADIDLAPLWDALRRKTLLKVFHAARQDLEIILTEMGEIPTPLFDTQIAASVLGFGEQAGFEALVRGLLHHQLDKGSQFTDWSRRPLSTRQMAYALDDVRYLEPVCEKIAALLADKGRDDWVRPDFEALANPGLYRTEPMEAWKRLKIKSDRPKDLAVLRELAAWREREAQNRNVPRGRILKDDPLVEMALHHPRTPEELTNIRGIDKGMAKNRMGQGVLDAVARGLACPEDQAPVQPRKKPLNDEQDMLLDVLKLLVRLRAREIGVAPRLLATSDDLDHLARQGLAGSALETGWRYDVLGQELAEGRLYQLRPDLKNHRVRIETPEQ